MAYKAFISYSHAADGKLAPALQSALHRFAKPWYRMRALRVFRDKTSLSASPALWPTIQQALSESEYFLLLASPEAARSPWVGREVEWWLANRPADRMLVVLTDGELAWDGAGIDFDWSRTTALPAGLRGKLREEPLYVDLRWAKSEENLSLRHSQFRGAILDIATPLHGRPKDELDGDDVRQHRKTRAITAAAVLALLVFAVGAAWAAVIATQKTRIAEEQTKIAEGQRRIAEENEHKAKDQEEIAKARTDEAKKERDEADNQRRIAVTQRERAETQTWIAVEQRKEAERQARIAEERRRIALGRQLAAQANSIRERQPKELALNILLALEGARHLRSEETDRALRAGLRLLPPIPKVLKHDDGVAGVARVPGGRLLTWTRKAAFLRDPESLRPLDSLACEGGWPFSSAVVSAQGRVVALRCNNGTARVWDLATGQSATVASEVVGGIALAPDGSWLGTIGRGGAVRIWSLLDGSRGNLVARFDPPKEEEHLSGAENAVLAVSPDGNFLARGFRGSSQIQVWPVPSRGDSRPPWNPDLSTDVGHVTAVAFDPSGRYLGAGTAMGHVQWWDSNGSGGNLRLGSRITDLAFSHDGGSLAVGIDGDTATPILQLSDGQVVARMQHGSGVSAVAFSLDDQRLATANTDGTARLWNPGDSSELARMAHGGSVVALAFSEDGRSLATASEDGTLRLWKIPEGPADGRAWPSVAESLSDDSFHTPDWRIVAEASGEAAVIRKLPGGAVVRTLRHESPLDWEAIERRDVERGGSIRMVKQQIERWKEGGSVEVKALSPDGTALLTTRADERLYLWDLRTGQERARFDGGDLSVFALSRRGDFVAAAGEDTARIWSADGRKITQVRHRCERSDLICRIDGLGLSHDGRRLVTIAQRVARLHEIRGAREIGGGAVHPAWETGLSPEGRYLPTQGRGKSVRIRDVLRGGAREIGLQEGAAITKIAFSPGESLLLLADQDGRAKIVELPGTREVAGLFPGPFSSAAFSGDGKLVAFDETVWDLAQRTKIAQLSGTGGIAGFSPDARYLLTPRGASRHEWLWRTDDLAETACARLERNLTRGEWERYVGDPARGGEPYRKTCPGLP